MDEQQEVLRCGAEKNGLLCGRLMEYFGGMLPVTIRTACSRNFCCTF